MGVIQYFLLEIEMNSLDVNYLIVHYYK
jgi:hypothetical protein